jgi:hypothetical protein
MRHTLRSVAAALIALAAASPADAGRPRAVVELFTSQGCSSCPPADALLAELARDEQVVALSLPVQLWDHLGWRDTLGTPENTARQQAYALGRRDRQVYTPQAVINGVAHVVGSSREAIEGKASRDAGLPVDIDCVEDGGRLSIRIAAWPAGGAAPPASILVLHYDREHVVDIPAGENGGRRVSYRNVVRRLEPLGAWNGAERTLSIAAPAPGRGLALLVQADADGHPGRVLGALRAD